MSGAVAEDLPGMVRALVRKVGRYLDNNYTNTRITQIQQIPGWWNKWKMVAFIKFFTKSKSRLITMKSKSNCF